MWLDTGYLPSININDNKDRIMKMRGISKEVRKAFVEARRDERAAKAAYVCEEIRKNSLDKRAEIEVIQERIRALRKRTTELRDSNDSVENYLNSRV